MRLLPSYTSVRAAAAGAVSGGLALGIGEAVAIPFGQSSAPFLAIGNTAVDLTPEWLKSFAIETFGENDKLVLLLGMAVVMLVGAIIAGVLELRKPPFGAVLLGLVGVMAAVTAALRPGAGVVDIVPSVVGAVIGIGLLRVLIGYLRAGTAPAQAANTPDATPSAPATGRRAFVTFALAGTALAAAGVAAGQWFGRAADTVRAARDRIRMPRPAEPPPAIPDGVQLDIDGITPFRTPAADFYRVDTALTVPAILPDEWKLRIHGMVDEPFELTYDDILDLDLIERTITLTCVSNEVGGDLAGNAAWLGYPIRDLLGRAGIQDDADMLLSTDSDGFTIGTPLAALTDGRDAMLVIGMNGEPLPLERGFPARLVVPGLYGFVSATKWVVDLEVTRFDQATAYWTDRGWAEKAPIKTASRIDVPGSFAQLSAGPNVVAGVAWAQHRGIATVEVRVDDGEWIEADLAAEASIDTWRLWSWEWDAEPGRHTLYVRATDGEGELQTDEKVSPIPTGASGWHSVAVEVS